MFSYACNNLIGKQFSYIKISTFYIVPYRINVSTYIIHFTKNQQRPFMKVILPYYVLHHATYTLYLAMPVHTHRPKSIKYPIYLM